jgi:hypothetical protein
MHWNAKLMHSCVVEQFVQTFKQKEKNLSVNFKIIATNYNNSKFKFIFT